MFLKSSIQSVLIMHRLSVNEAYGELHTVYLNDVMDSLCNPGWVKG